MSQPRIVIIGAGPAGLAAAATALKAKAAVTLLDENPRVGGQIWRHPPGQIAAPARYLRDQLAAQPDFKLITGAQALSVHTGLVSFLAQDKVQALSCDGAILACGARELLLPFPGWTLPDCFGAGGAQAMLKAGMSAEGRRVVVAGTGPLLFAVAAAYQKAGAQVVAVVEQAPAAVLGRFLGHLALHHPGKMLQGALYRTQLWRSRFLTGSWIKEAHGRDRVESVTVTDGHSELRLDCDLVACGYGLIPSSELAAASGCRLRPDGAVEVDELLRTNRKGVYACGELTGIGGVDKSLVEGAIAGAIAAGAERPARALLAERRDALRLAARLEYHFALRDELKSLARPSTILCRCEDVTYGEVASVADTGQRAAKLYSRCGMGSCQGRICTAAGRFLFGWSHTNRIKAPLIPLTPAQLIAWHEVKPAQPRPATKP